MCVSHPTVSAVVNTVIIPFITDTAWPAGLLTIFAISPRELQLFQDSYEYYVAPQGPISELDTVDFIVFLVVFDVQYRPVLVPEIKDNGWISRQDLRFKADDQMRQLYDALLGACPLSCLWGLSLLGPSFRVYCGNVVTGEIGPIFEDRPSPSCALPRDYLEGAWNINILSQAGFVKMEEVAEVIFGSVAALKEA